MAPSAHLHAPPEQRAGFYGLDVYSLLESLESVLAHLKKVDDKEATKAAENAIRCFQQVSRSHEDLGQVRPPTPHHRDHYHNRE